MGKKFNHQGGSLLKLQKRNDNHLTVFITNGFLVKILGTDVEYHAGQAQDSEEH